MTWLDDLKRLWGTPTAHRFCNVCFKLYAPEDLHACEHGEGQNWLPGGPGAWADTTKRARSYKV